jgi:hypothetical protein
MSSFKRLGQAHRTLLDQRNPAWRSYLAWFEIYLALGATPPTEVRDAMLLPAQPWLTGNPTHAQCLSRPGETRWGCWQECATLCPATNIRS